MFGKRETTVKLTEKEMEKLMAGMTRQERKEFLKRQRRAEDDRISEALMFAEIMDDD
ncbi:MAG: hypothetical protein LUI02_04590 [Clostridiales bacterium]|nr:hypothetical protein [Clostridiales bacterium]